MDDLALKQLKVPDLKRILADAGISVPSRLNKADLVARIQAEPDALAVFRAQHQPASAPSPAPPAATRPSPAPSPAAAPAQTASSTPPPVSAADAELEKRKARAARFGIPLIKPPPVLSEVRSFSLLFSSCAYLYFRRRESSGLVRNALALNLPPSSTSTKKNALPPSQSTQKSSKNAENARNASA
jgi:hypothetical protein